MRRKSQKFTCEIGKCSTRRSENRTFALLPLFFHPCLPQLPFLMQGLVTWRPGPEDLGFCCLRNKEAHRDRRMRKPAVLEVLSDGFFFSLDKYCSILPSTQRAPRFEFVDVSIGCSSGVSSLTGNLTRKCRKQFTKCACESEWKNKARLLDSRCTKVRNSKCIT